MIINWGALVLVAVVTIVAAIAIVGLFSLGVAALTSRQRADAAPAPWPSPVTAAWRCPG